METDSGRLPAAGARVVRRVADGVARAARAAREPLSLRATLLLMTLAAGVYAGVLPLYLFVRARAAALAPGEGTAAIVALQDDLARRNSGLHHAAALVRRLAESRTRPAPGSLDSVRLVIAATSAPAAGRPLAELEAGLARVAEGDLTTGVPVRGSDELGRLAQHFNEMARVLRDRAEEQGRFAAAGELLAGVAHEVNNPLMAIAAHAENSIADPALAEPQRAEMLQILRQARRAAK